MEEQLFIVNLHDNDPIIILTDKTKLAFVMEDMERFDLQIKFIQETLGDSVLKRFNELHNCKSIVRLFFNNTSGKIEFTLIDLSKINMDDYSIGRVYATEAKENAYYVSRVYMGKQYCLFI